MSLVGGKAGNQVVIFTIRGAVSDSQKRFWEATLSELQSRFGAQLTAVAPANRATKRRTRRKRGKKK